MSDIMCCPLSEADEPASFARTNVRTARKVHVCCECREEIPAGIKYEHVAGLWDGQIATYKTCLSCVEIRDHFGCNGWIYTLLWEDLESSFFPDMRAGGPCMEGLSPEAKQRLFDRRMAWLEERARPSTAGKGGSK